MVVLVYHSNMSANLENIVVATGLGKQILGCTNRTLCAPGPRRKEQWSHKRLTQTCLWVSRSLWQRCGSVVAYCRVGSTEGCSSCTGTFWRRSPLSSLHTIVWSQVKQQGGNTENWINIYWAWHPHKIKTQFATQSLPSRSFHKLLILIHQRADRMKTTIT